MPNGISKETFSGMPAENQNEVLFDLQRESLLLLKGTETKAGFCTRLAIMEVSLSRLWKWVAAVSLAVFVWAVLP
jgi:hypothetical protein